MAKPKVTDPIEDIEHIYRGFVDSPSLLQNLYDEEVKSIEAAFSLSPVKLKEKPDIPANEEWNKLIKANNYEDIKRRLFEKHGIKDVIGGTGLEDVEEAIVTYGLDDVSEYPGASFSIRFKDYFDDPAKALWEDFVVNPAKSVVNVKEWSSYGRANAWGQFMTGEKRAGFKSLNLSTGLNSSNEAVKKDYTYLVQATKKFAQNAESSKSRNSAVHDFHLQHLHTLQAELDSVVSDLGAFNSLTPSQRSRIVSARDSIAAKNALLASIHGEVLYENGMPVYKNGKLKRVGGLKSHLTDTMNALDKPFFTAQKADEAKVMTNLNNALYEVRRARARLGRLASQDVRAANAMSKYLEGIERGLSSDKFVTIDSATGQITAVHNLNALNAFLKKETDKMFSNEMDAGIVGSMTMRFSRILRDDKNLQDALVTIDPNTGRRVFTEASTNSLNVSNAVDEVQDWEAIGDFITDLLDGKVDRQYIFKRFIKPRIEKFTPSYWMKRGRERWLKGELFKDKGLGKLINRTGLKVNGAMSWYQAKWDLFAQKRLVKIMRFIGNRGELLKQQISRLIADGIAFIVARTLDAAPGLGAAVEKVLRIVTRYVVNKVVDYTQKFWKAVRQLDFESMEEIFKGIGKIMLVVLSPCIIWIGCIMAVIVCILAALLAFDSTQYGMKINENIYGKLPQFGGYNAQNCDLNAMLPITFPINSDFTAAAEQGYNLVNSLMKGFWCYWNRHPNYDNSWEDYDLFDEYAFIEDPYPAAIQNCAYCLFWCTWLPYIAYENAGSGHFDSQFASGGEPAYLSADNMYNFFKNTASNTFIDAKGAGALWNVRSGDIVFFNTASGSGWHVGMVAYVDDTGVMTIHSNTPFKQLYFNADTNSGVIYDDAALTILGFGRP